jgi:hypothetical protein
LWKSLALLSLALGTALLFADSTSGCGRRSHCGSACYSPSYGCYDSSRSALITVHAPNGRYGDSFLLPYVQGAFSQVHFVAWNTNVPVVCEYTFIDINSNQAVKHEFSVSPSATFRTNMAPSVRFRGVNGETNVNVWVMP